MSFNARETLEQAGVTLVRETNNGITVETDEGKHEYWVKSPGYSGYALLHNGCEYEFVSEVANPMQEPQTTTPMRVFLVF